MADDHGRPIDHPAWRLPADVKPEPGYWHGPAGVQVTRLSAQLDAALVRAEVAERELRRRDAVAAMLDAGPARTARPVPPPAPEDDEPARGDLIFVEMKGART